MNRKLVVSILALLLVLAMVFSLLIGVIPIGGSAESAYELSACKAVAEAAAAALAV